LTIKVTGGQHRGRSIPSPKGKIARPTASKIRQALFNILADKVTGANFLDLYAGSGIMGLEALSRGDNLDLFSLEADVLAEDIRSCGSRLEKNFYDLIFADPPYGANLSQPTIHLVDRKCLLKDGGVFILEHQHTTILDLSKTSLIEKDKRVYGQTVLTFIGRKDR
jgi:16S rRNA (guanine966-N2)-methyltransferase